mgnify:CR=1 FL=1
MADTERLLQMRKAEQLRKMREWDDICPDDAFVDAPIKENLTGKHAAKKTNEDFAGGSSSLEEIV